MTWVDTLSTAVDNVFSTSLTERNGTVVPTTDSVTNSQAVKLNATFLYADLAGSAMLSRVCPWQTTAKIMRAYLDCTTRLIRAWGGEIRSFDGDRVMGVFVGDMKNTHATSCAREIFYTVEKILGPKATIKFDSIRNNGIKLKNGIGIDTGETRAVRAGIRHSNDLIWIGRAPSLAAKLSDVRDYAYCVYISEDSYKFLPDTSKIVDGKNIWVEQTFTFAGESHKAFKTLYMKTP
ncbi:adenylate/guanylate cyclase domain-containing protein [Sphingomonas sp. CFBP 8760]|uniref:adenylate/guanylate cyclase domain-containing protein n=1 Tax=Sphingomonas sp. CFBP 8760 TaxID=2775282 RepID=UPI00177DACA7|nr:adenylate/guanylate cyclase domain-containing protein [Sphingomonas sp. CFBP 8760]MBD8546057.1 adenylate/guanylate cyclase domain-containing protein [Sphingomonas sp. CFBP 8760]